MVEEEGFTQYTLDRLKAKGLEKLRKGVGVGAEKAPDRRSSEEAAHSCLHTTLPKY